MSQSDTNKTSGFTEDEKDAMRTRAKEIALEAKQAKNRTAGENDVQAAIAAMPEPDQSLAKRVHEIITTTAPGLWTKTWYGMPAYTTNEGKVICFFQPASKFKYRYSTLGFQEDAHLDEGNMWPAAYALTRLTAVEEKRIIELVKKAMG